MDNERVDQRIAEVLEKLRIWTASDQPLNEWVALRHMRVAYLDGYLDGCVEEPPLTEEIPMLNFHKLYLP